jgi:peptidyl-prolyl cis-trans isomerase D
VLSPDAKESVWVLNELTLADEFKKRVFPVLVRGDFRDSIPFRLVTRQFVDLRTNEADGLESLSTALGRYLNELKRIEDERQTTELEAERQKKEAEHLVAQRVEEELVAKTKLEAEHLAEEKANVEKKAKERAKRIAAQKAEEERVAKTQIESKQLAEKVSLTNNEADGKRKIQEKKLATEKPKGSDTANKLHRKSAKIIEEAKGSNARTTKITAKKVGIISVVMVVAILFGYLSIHYSQLERVFVEVNGETFTISQWQERVRLQRVSLLNQLSTYDFYQQNFGTDTSQQKQQINDTLKSPEVLGQQVLDLMVDELLIRQESERRGIIVPEDEIEKNIQEAYGYYANGTPTPTANPLATNTSFITSEPISTVVSGPTATPYTLDSFKSEYANTIEKLKSYNISTSTIRSMYASQLYRQKLFEIITADAPRSEEQVWARHILVNDLPTAQTVRNYIIEGQDFSTIAKNFSIDSGNAQAGGDLGWFTRGVMVTEFETAAFSQKIGEISSPIQSQFGFHIIQVLGHENRPVDNSRYQANREKIFNAWLSEIRNEGSITIDEMWKQLVPLEPATINN